MPTITETTQIYKRLHQGDARGDLGRDHQSRGGSIPGQGGGWAFILSDLKSLLETGSSICD